MANEEVKREAERIISEHPRLIRAIKNRPTVVSRGPVRESILDFAEDVAENLRSRQFQVNMSTQVLTESVINLLLGIGRDAITPEIEERINEAEEKGELPRDELREMIR